MLFLIIAAVAVQSPNAVDRKCGEMCELARASAFVDPSEALDRMLKEKDNTYRLTGVKMRPYLDCQTDYFKNNPFKAGATDLQIDQTLQGAYEACAELRAGANLALADLLRARDSHLTEDLISQNSIAARAALGMTLANKAFQRTGSGATLTDYMERTRRTILQEKTPE